MSVAEVIKAMRLSLCSKQDFRYAIFSLLETINSGDAELRPSKSKNFKVFQGSLDLKTALSLNGFSPDYLCFKFVDRTGKSNFAQSYTVLCYATVAPELYETDLESQLLGRS